MSGLAPELPAPEPLELARSEALRARVEANIAAEGGSVAFERYMSVVLNDPELGYYARGVSGFGAAGDFVTAPELSPVFAHAVAQALHPALTQIGPTAEVLEIGAGSGALAEGLIGALQGLGALPSRYLILEPSATLQAVQRQRLQTVAKRSGCPVEWLTSLEEVAIEGVVVANEVVDALPVERFERTDEGFVPMHVGLRDGRFCELAAPAYPELRAWGDSLEARLGYPLGPGYRSERCRWLDPWLKAVAETLVKGFALIFDYGYAESEYYHPERVDGTLMCYYRHRAHPDPFFLPGLQDLTASVDFTAMASMAHTHGLEVSGYTTQAWFLIENGLAEYVQSYAGNEREYAALAGAVRTLTLPGEMGERVKCMALGKGDLGPLPGFSQRDLRRRL